MLDDEPELVAQAGGGGESREARRGGPPAGRHGSGGGGGPLSVRSLISNEPALSFVLNSCIVFCERRFVRTFDLQKGFSLRVSEAVNHDDGCGNLKEMVWVPKI